MKAMIDLSKWKAGQSYSYDYLESYIDNPEHESNTYGEFLLGKEFIVITDDRENRISFVLNSHTGIGAHYKLIWKG